MDEFAGLVVIFAIIGIVDKVLKASNKDRKSREKSRKTVQRMPSATPESARPARAKPAPTVAPTVRAAAPTVQAAPAANAAIPRLPMEILEIPEIQKAAMGLGVPGIQKAAPEAASQEDPEGCIGGSIRHAQHEGEARAEHEKHLEVSRVPAAEPEKLRIARGLTANDLRRAVVMSEILDRPKALRRNGA